jgi:hypothetical protein
MRVVLACSLATVFLLGCGGANGGPLDMASASTDGGQRAFGDLCTLSSDCQSNLCAPFAMHTIMRCTKPCTTATQAADCPPPSAGTCTPNNYCRFNM